MKFGKSSNFTFNIKKRALPENPAYSPSFPFPPKPNPEEYLSKWEEGTLGPMYLKDWHFKKSFKEAMIYETPKIFEDDWLNGWWDR